MRSSVCVGILCLFVAASIVVPASSANVYRWHMQTSPGKDTDPANDVVVRNSWTLESVTGELQKPRWVLEVAVATTSAWSTPPNGTALSPCPQCAIFASAARTAVDSLITHGLLANALPEQVDEGDAPHNLYVAFYEIDCSTLDSSASHGIAAFPCGEQSTFPALQVSLREGSRRVLSAATFRGVGDALGIANFIQSKLPVSYGLTKPAIANVISPALGRSMLVPASRSAPLVPAKELVTFVKENPDKLVVVLAMSTMCRHCARWSLMLDAAQRILNASGISERSIPVFRVVLDDSSVWKSRWLAEGAEGQELPALLLFLPNTLTDGKPQPIPLRLRSESMSVRFIFDSLSYWGGAVALNATWDDVFARHVEDAVLGSSIAELHRRPDPMTVQLNGLRNAALSEYLTVVTDSDRVALDASITVPPGLDRNSLVEAGLVEGDLRSRHMFVVLFAASWTSTTNGAIMRDVHQFVSLARRYDNTNNAVTASFTVVDLHSTSFRAGSHLHELYLGGDQSMGVGDLCLDPPCVFTCVQLTSQKDARRCGGTDLPFNYLPAALDVDALERALNLAADPTSDSEINIKPLDTLSLSLQAASHRILYLDSLRPWLSLDKSEVLSLTGDEGPKSITANSITFRRNVLVLFHGGQQLSANGVWYNRRLMKNFDDVCRQLNISTQSPGKHAQRENVCAAVNIHQFPKLTHHVRTTFNRVSSEHLRQSVLGADPRSPFVALMSRMDGNDAIISDGDLDAAGEDMQQRRMVLDVTPEMLLLHPSRVAFSVAAVLGKQKEYAEAASGRGALGEGGLVAVTANQLWKTVTDPERGVLILYSGGASCPHSAPLHSLMRDVAGAFVRERREVTIAVVDAARELDVEERKHVYKVARLPTLMWYPKGVGKHPSRSGEEYRGLPQKLQLIEYVNDEMGYSFYEMDWLKDSTIRAVTRRDWDANVGGPSARNRSHTVLLLYRTMQQDVKTAEMLRDLEKRLSAHVDFARTPVPHQGAPDEEESVGEQENLGEIPQGLQATFGGIEFFKMDARRFERFLSHQGLLKAGEGSTLPRLVFLPRGPMKVEHARSTSNPAVLLANDIVSMAQFVLDSVDRERYGSDAVKVLPFTSQEIAHHKSAQDGAANGPSDDTTANATSTITELDLHGFRSFVDDENVDAVVLFYATWCAHSKAFEPHYQEVTNYFGSDPSIRFGRVDVPKNDETGHGQGILSFPTVKFYFAGSKDKAKLIGTEYRGMEEFLSSPPQRNATRNLYEYIATTRRSTRVQELDHQRQLLERALVELNDTSLGDVVHTVTDQYLVEFYAPWCGHCRTVIPELQAVGEYFRRQRRMNPIRPRLNIARVDAIKFRNVSAALNATNFYPTILLFTNERNAKGAIVRRVHKYNDHRLAERMIEFVSTNMPKVATDHDGRKKKTSSAQQPVVDRTSNNNNKKSSSSSSSVVDEMNLPKPEPTMSEGDIKQQKRTKKSTADVIEDMYTKEDDLKEVIRKRNVQKKRSSGGHKHIKVIERSKVLSRHVQFLNEKSLREFLDTTTVVAVLYCEAKVDEEYLEAWNVVAENFDQLIQRRLVVIGVVEAGESTPILKGMLGDAPSITIFRGLATPQIVRYKMLDPYEDHDAYAHTRFGQGGSGTNATEVVAFVKQEIHRTLMHSVEFTSIKQFDEATQNMSAKVMVMFYAPWSEDARTVAPHYDALAQQYRHITNVFIARLDISKHLKVHDTMRKAKLPLFLVYDDVPEEIRGRMSPSDRKIPRRLITQRPSRQQLGAFLIHDDDEVGRDDRDWQEEWFVPYGDETREPPVVKYGTSGKANALLRAEWESSRRDHEASMGTGRFSHASVRGDWQAVPLASFDDAQNFVSTYAPKRGALIFFSSSWCKHCAGVYRAFTEGAAKVASSVAVALFNVTKHADSKRLKTSSVFGMSSFPTVLLFGGDNLERVEYTDKHRGGRHGGASALIKFVAATTNRMGLQSPSGPLPTYPSSAVEVPSSARSVSTDIPAADSTLVSGLLSEMTTVAETEELLLPLLAQEDGHEGAATLIFLNASWCPRERCGRPLRDVLLSTHSLVASRPQTPFSVQRLSLTDKAVKAFAIKHLGVASVPAVVVVCNGTAHRFSRLSLDLAPLTVASELIGFAEDVCFGLLPLEQQRKKLQDALEEAEEGELTPMTVASLLSPEGGENIFAMMFNGTTCNRDPHCREATRLMRLLSGTYKNRQLVFAAVDESRPENKNREEQEKGHTQLASTGSVRLIYHPVEQPPVPYEGDLDKADLLAFLDDEERRSRDSHRRI